MGRFRELLNEPQRRPEDWLPPVPVAVATTPADVDAAIDAHVAEADPHTQYLRMSYAKARFFYG